VTAACGSAEVHPQHVAERPSGSVYGCYGITARHCRGLVIHEQHQFYRRGVLCLCPGIEHTHRLCCAEHDHHAMPHAGCFLGLR
jgi:hypothetical protein